MITAESEGGQAGKTVTVTAGNNFIAGQQVTISDTPTSGYDGIFTVGPNPTSTSFTYTATTSGLSSFTFPTATAADGSSALFMTKASEAQIGGNWVATILAQNSFYSGEQVLIAGMPDPGYNGTVTITSADGASFSYTVQSSTLATYNPLSSATATVTDYPTREPVPAPGRGTYGHWANEEALDVEWAHALAPAAKIILVEANDGNIDNLHGSNSAGLGSALITARNNPDVSVISMSFGGPEVGSGPEPETLYDQNFTTPSGHGGITFVASSGDQSWPSYPAASPNVLGVGGTTLTLDANNNWQTETAWSSSGGALSTIELKPSYQSGVSSASHRGVPDVAFDADLSTGVAVCDSYKSNLPSQPWIQEGGTSLSAPAWASLIAIADQLRGSLGTLDGFSQTLPYLYQMPYSSFHDITQGGNNSGAAHAGYDLVTGLGSPIANLVVSNLTTHLVVTAPSSVTAGTAFSVTVTAVNAGGTTYTGYTGTVHFISSDIGAGLPADYQFTTADNGMHTFSVTLKTAANQVFTATDTSYTMGSANISVSPGVAAGYAFSIAGGSVPINSPFSVTVTAQDSYGNTITGYTGTVQFTSNGPATLPGNYTFTTGTGHDNGVHTFNGITLTAANQTVTVTDTVSSITSTLNTTPMVVTSFQTTTTGFSVTFSKPFVPADLTLYGTGLSTVQDITLVGAHVGAINGSVIIDPSYTKITFKATANSLELINSNFTLPVYGDPVLPDDTYTATLISGSGSNGFFDSSGIALDGTSTGGHANYTTGTRTIASATESGSTATITTSVAHGFTIGQTVVIAGSSNASYNGSFTILSIPSSTTFTYSTAPSYSNLPSATGGTASTAFTTTYQDTAHNHSHPVQVLAIPDFARGPDSSSTIKVPNDTGHGIPVTLYNASSVTDAIFTLDYNPQLLTPTGGGAGDATGAGSSFTLGTITNIDATHATAAFTFHNSSAQSGTVVLGDILAVVPNSAASSYRAKELLQLGTITVNGSQYGSITVNGLAFTGVTASALHVNAYFGDVSGSLTGDVTGNGTTITQRIITTLDVTLANQVAQGASTGFAAYTLVDPVIVGDVALDYSVDAGDVSDISAYINHLFMSVIPIPPTGLTISFNITSLY